MERCLIHSRKGNGPFIGDAPYLMLFKLTLLLLSASPEGPDIIAVCQAPELGRPTKLTTLQRLPSG